MKVLILGASGKTGGLVMQYAKAAGHDVTVLVRDESHLEATEGLTVLTGDATSRVDLTAAMVGQDAVISALGAAGVKTNLFSSFADALVYGAKQVGLARAIVLSNFGAGQTIEQANFTQRLIYKSAMKALLADKTKADDILTSSDLDWTLAYAVTLDNGPATGVTPVARLVPKGNPKVSRSDVAQFLVDSLSDSSWSRRIAILAG